MASIAERPTKPHPKNVFLDRPRIPQDTKTSCQKTWLGPRLGHEFWKDVEGCWPPQPSFKSPKTRGLSGNKHPLLLANSPPLHQKSSSIPNPKAKFLSKKLPNIPPPSFRYTLSQNNNKRPNGPTGPTGRGATAAWTKRCPTRRRGVGGHPVQRLGRGDARHARCWCALAATGASGGALDGGVIDEGVQGGGFLGPLGSSKTWSYGI